MPDSIRSTARPLKRAIQEHLENPLAREILAGRFAAGDTVRVDAEGGKLVFRREPASQAASTFERGAGWTAPRPGLIFRPAAA